MSKTHEINVIAANGELVIREGEASEPRDPKIINLTGILDSPYRWLDKRYEEGYVKSEVNGNIPIEFCHVAVDRENMTIALHIGEQNYFGTTITGRLELHPKFKKFGINAGEYITPFEMAEKIKMNRSFFENHSVAMELVSVLKNFKAKVNKQIEASDNNRGDKRALVDQVVNSNVPETFTLQVPIFKGMPSTAIECEVYFRAEDLTCTLVSPAANDEIESIRDRAIDQQLDLIKGLAPDLVIIEK